MYLKKFGHEFFNILFECICFLFDLITYWLLEFAGRRNAGDEGGASARENECEREVFGAAEVAVFSNSIQQLK